jgi:hypothetical protein
MTSELNLAKYTTLQIYVIAIDFFNLFCSTKNVKILTPHLICIFLSQLHNFLNDNNKVHSFLNIATINVNIHLQIKLKDFNRCYILWEKILKSRFS